MKAVSPVDSGFLKKQLSVLLADVKPDALKTGMLYSAANIGAVASVITKKRLSNVVVDPVLISSSGRRLSEPGVVAAFRRHLLPLSTVVTPNMHEASALAGVEVSTLEDMKEAARILRNLGARNVIITGGHLDRTAADVFYDGEFRILRGRKIAGEYHGTGCRFSAAIAALLAKGSSAAEAASQAKDFMLKSLHSTFSTGKGMRLFNV